MRKCLVFRAFSAVVVCLAGPEAMGNNLTLTTGGRVTIELVSSDASFSNTLSVVTPAVTLATTGCKLEPATGLTGTLLLSEKVAQRGCRVELDSDAGTPGIQGFAAGTTFEFRMCAQTDADADCEFVWSSNSALNADGFDHLQTTPIQAAAFPGRIFQLAWEDLSGGGDLDFNDLIVVLRVDVDTDGDGLWDDWEQFGVDTDGNGTVDLDLPALGANPMRQDIFLEVDFMDCAVAGGDCVAGDTHSHAPKAAAIAAAVQAFANAPVPNPDTSTGISLHLLTGNAIPHQNTLAIGCGFGSDGFNAVKSDPANFGPTNPRRFAFHYGVFGHLQATTTTSSGCAERPGNDLLITLGEWNTICILPGANGVIDTVPAGDDLSIDNFIHSGPNLVCNTTAAGDDVQSVANGSSPPSDLDGDGLDDRRVGTIMQQAGTLLHEFGHNLQLDHGGGNGLNRKPNYLSVMNYAFQTRGIGLTDPDGAGPLTARLDYSSQDLPDLNENSLSEPAGVGDGTDTTRFFCPNGSSGTGPASGAIDWNCNGIATNNPVAVNINGDRDAANMPILGVLDGYDDWENLRLDFQTTGSFEDGVYLTPPDLELDQPTHLTIPVTIQIDVKPDTPVNPINPRSLGVIPVAILTTGTFDASTVDPLTARFGPAGALVRDGRATIADVDHDGDLDLLLQFRTAETGLACGATQVTLSAETFAGERVTAVDAVLTVGCK